MFTKLSTVWNIMQRKYNVDTIRSTLITQANLANKHRYNLRTTYTYKIVIKIIIHSRDMSNQFLFLLIQLKHGWRHVLEWSKVFYLKTPRLHNMPPVSLQYYYTNHHIRKLCQCEHLPSQNKHENQTEELSAQDVAILPWERSAERTASLRHEQKWEGLTQTVFIYFFVSSRRKTLTVPHSRSDAHQY